MTNMINDIAPIASGVPGLRQALAQGLLSGEAVADELARRANKRLAKGKTVVPACAKLYAELTGDTTRFAKVVAGEKGAHKAAKAGKAPKAKAGKANEVSPATIVADLAKSGVDMGTLFVAMAKALNV